MPVDLKVLFIEDSKDDLILIVHELKKGDFLLDYKCVDNFKSFEQALNDQKWDIIIADYILPGFSGLEALHHIQHINLDIPFLIVSGAIGEDIAVSAMKSGAQDYILKNNLKRLIPAIHRELKDAEIRKNKNIVENQLYHNAFYDTLTGLPNRALFSDRLGQSLNRVQRKKNYLFAVLILDVDRFRIINESLGHKTGDHLLTILSKRLQTCVRPGDTLSRFGVDEFLILLEDLDDINEATLVAENIQNKVMTPFTLNEHEVFINISIGISLSTKNYTCPEDIIRDADTALQNVKSMGQSRYKIFDQKMHTNTMDKLKLESDLRKAIKQKEFIVYYQPIISISDYKIMAFEALIRWQNQNGQLVQPDDFIPWAEETGLIIPIDRIILTTACKQLHDWLNKFPSSKKLSISVNMSGISFSQPDLADFISDLLKKFSLPPQSLILEITESIFIHSFESERNLLQQLKNLGIQLYIDDFGTGYSSLSYLTRFPIDVLKIDRTFVSQIGLDHTSTAIVNAIINLAKTLNIELIAEGIETSRQLQILKEMQCHYGQGFLFCHPLNPSDATTLIEKDKIFNPLL